MAKIPRQVARRVIPSGRVAGAFIPTSLADVGQGIEAQGLANIGRGISGLGITLGELARRKQVAEDSLAVNTAKESRELANAEMRQFMVDSPNPATWIKGRNEINARHIQRFDELEMSDRARALQDVEEKGFLEKTAISAEIDATVQTINDSIVVSEKNLLSIIANDDGSAESEVAIDNQKAVYRQSLEGKYADDVANVILENTIATGLEERAKRAVEDIKPALIEAIETADKEEGIKTLDLATDRLVESGILTKAEGAQANKVLGDWIDNFVAGRFKQAKDAVKLTTTEAYADLSGKIVSGTLTFQDIDESSLLKDDKEKWRIYIKGSYKDAPTENTPRGLTDAVIAAFDAATLQLSPTEAADILLEARFIDHSITNDQFNWGLDKIKNPYPRQIMEDLRATYNSNNEDFNRIFKADKDRNKNVNEALIAWVDDLIKRDKVPAFDFKKKMHAVSSQFRVGNARWYDIGQIIERGGRNWEVVGFDENGEPLVDEVQ